MMTVCENIPQGGKKEVSPNVQCRARCGVRFLGAYVSRKVRGPSTQTLTVMNTNHEPRLMPPLSSGPMLLKPRVDQD